MPIHSDNVVTETSGISQMPRDYTHSNGAIEDAKLSEDRRKYYVFLSSGSRPLLIIVSELFITSSH